uniref:Phosphorylated adapter RNA export protein n=1 Tax=Angiostrongylus cantonensis TaxID=6313 RepID=A0A0K0DBZ2_ANGCA
MEQNLFQKGSNMALDKPVSVASNPTTFRRLSFVLSTTSPSERYKILNFKVADRSHLLSPSYSLETLMAVEFPTDISIEQLGDEMAKALGERNPKPIRPIVVACGTDKAISLFEETRKVECSGGMMIDNGQRRRTPGGVFISLFKLDPDIPEDIKVSLNFIPLAELMKKEKEKDTASNFLKPLPPAEVLYRQDLMPDADKRVSNDEEIEDAQTDP